MPVAGGPRATQGQAEQRQFNGECNAAVPPSTGACRFQCGRRIALAFDSESHNLKMISCPFWKEQGEEGSISVCFRALHVHHCAPPITGRQALRVTYYSATLVTRVQRLAWTCPGHRGVPARPILCDRGKEDSSERALVFPALTVDQH